MEFCIKGLNKPYSFLNSCYKTYFTLAISLKSLTFATCFFIVLDLRLTKVGVQRNSFFYALNLNKDGKFI